MNYCALTFKNFNCDILNDMHLNHKGMNIDSVYSFGTLQHTVPSVHIWNPTTHGTFGAYLEPYNTWYL